MHCLQECSANPHLGQFAGGSPSMGNTVPHSAHRDTCRLPGMLGVRGPPKSFFGRASAGRAGALDFSSPRSMYPCCRYFLSDKTPSTCSFRMGNSGWVVPQCITPVKQPFGEDLAAPQKLLSAAHVCGQFFPIHGTCENQQKHGCADTLLTPHFSACVLLHLWHFGCVHNIRAVRRHVPHGLSSERPVMKSRELRIEPPGTKITNEYRINGDSLEFRVRDSSARYYPPQGTLWRALSEDELNTHIALNTVVAQWMSSRIWQSTQN